MESVRMAQCPPLDAASKWNVTHASMTEIATPDVASTDDASTPQTHRKRNVFRLPHPLLSSPNARSVAPTRNVKMEYA